MRHISEIMRAVGLDPIEMEEESKCPGETYQETKDGETGHRECLGGQVLDYEVKADLYSPGYWETRPCKTCGGSGVVTE